MKGGVDVIRNLRIKKKRNK